jgi:hypothetical protein
MRSSFRAKHIHDNIFIKDNILLEINDNIFIKDNILLEINDSMFIEDNILLEINDSIFGSRLSLNNRYYYTTINISFI